MCSLSSTKCELSSPRQMRSELTFSRDLVQWSESDLAKFVGEINSKMGAHENKQIWWVLSIDSLELLITHPALISFPQMHSVAITWLNLQTKANVWWSIQMLEVWSPKRQAWLNVYRKPLLWFNERQMGMQDQPGSEDWVLDSFSCRCNAIESWKVLFQMI